MCIHFDVYVKRVGCMCEKVLQYDVDVEIVRCIWEECTKYIEECTMYMGSDASHIHLHVEIVKMYMGSDTSHIHPTHFTYTSYTLHIHILHT